MFTVSRGDYLAAFERERGSGRLSQFACAEEEQTYKSCTSGRGLPGANAVAASPDARSLYVTSSGDRLLVFAASVAMATARVTADRGATIRVALACPVARREGCRGVLATRGVLRGRAFRLAAGRTSRTTIRLPGRVAKQLRARGRARLTLVARESRRPFGAASRLVTVLRR